MSVWICVCVSGVCEWCVWFVRLMDGSWRRRHASKSTTPSAANSRNMCNWNWAKIGGHVVVRAPCNAFIWTCNTAQHSTAHSAAYKLHNASAVNETQSQSQHGQQIELLPNRNSNSNRKRQVKPCKCNEMVFNFCNFSTEPKKKTINEEKNLKLNNLKTQGVGMAIICFFDV